ncbi:MAG: hypothetical protein ABW136_12090 [Steroidobacteraceae bacterium]
MTRWAALALAAAAFVPAYVATAAEPIQNDEIGVLKLFDEFVSSGAAASQCAQPDDTAAARFLSNFQWVSSHATAEIGRQMTESNPIEVAAELARRSKDIKDRTHAMVREQGCEAEPVQLLVRRFALQASWKRSG